MTILKLNIQHQFKGQIWRMLIDADEHLLYIEVRDAESREVSFSGFDLSTGKATFTDLQTDEKWLTGIEACYDGVLFLHGYQSAQSPIHKGIIAIDGSNGKVLWNNYTYAIQHLTANGPIIYNTQVQPIKLLLINAQNGATLRPYNTSFDVDAEQNIQLPHLIDSPDDGFKAYVKGDVVGNVHYMEYNSFRIVSLHTLNKSQLRQILLVMQGSNLLYEDLLTDEIQKLQPEAFIMQHNRLIYITNKVELKVLNL